jgi:hypothetical protein
MVGINVKQYFNFFVNRTSRLIAMDHKKGKEIGRLSTNVQ